MKFISRLCTFLFSLNGTPNSGVWLDFYEGRASIQKVLAAYDEHGFDANQDLPGNMLWEEMYDASPKGTKVILTIRESDEKWWKSWCGFLQQGRLKIDTKSFVSHQKKVIIHVSAVLPVKVSTKTLSVKP